MRLLEDQDGEDRSNLFQYQYSRSIPGQFTFLQMLKLGVFRACPVPMYAPGEASKIYFPIMTILFLNELSRLFLLCSQFNNLLLYKLLSYQVKFY